MREFAIEHLKSGLSVNTHMGCPLNCKYCILSNITDFPKQATEIESPENIVNACLNNNNLYIKDLTPIFINNRTDPLLPTVKESTYKLLSLFKENKVKSPLLLITKLAPEKQIADYFKELNLMFIYTYTGLPKGVDYNSNDKINSYNIDKVIKYVPRESRFHYFRPIIPGLNDDVQVFENVVDTVGKYFDTTIIGGIRILDRNKKLINEISGGNVKEFDINHKVFNNSFPPQIEEVIHKYKINVVRHTSCAIARFMKYRVKLDYFEREGHCFKSCFNFDICKVNHNGIVKAELLDSVKRITESRFTLNNDELIFCDSISQEVLSALKCAYGIKVKAKEVELCPSEKQFLN